eukprot:616471-Pyramimonas_sp.AAC.1
MALLAPTSSGKAWMVSEVQLDVLDGLLQHLMAGRRAPGPLSDYLFAFLPTGSDPPGARACIRGPSAHWASFFA